MRQHGSAVLIGLPGFGAELNNGDRVHGGNAASVASAATALGSAARTADTDGANGGDGVRHPPDFRRRLRSRPSIK